MTTEHEKKGVMIGGVFTPFDQRKNQPGERTQDIGELASDWQQVALKLSDENRRLCSAIGNTERQSRQYKEQRDSLLAALKRVQHCDSYKLLPVAACNVTDAAIAAAEGRAQ